jgi:hypothetical protein
MFLLFGAVFSGCSSIEKTSTHVSWYENLNPATEVTLSDWSILDLDTASYKGEETFADQLAWESVELFW